MTHLNNIGPLSLKQRLRCLLSATESEAEAILQGNSCDSANIAIGKRVGLDLNDMRSLIDSHSKIKNTYININKVTSLQLSSIPEMQPQFIRTTLEGRPYFSLPEFEEASNLSNSRIRELFSVPSLESIDKVTGKRRQFEPVLGKYLARPKLDFEEDNLLQTAGFTEISAGEQASIRLIVPSDLEAGYKIHELKQTLGGQVFPVLRDSEGFERYFVPAIIDVWFQKFTPASIALKVLNKLEVRVKQAYAKVGFYQVELSRPPSDFHVTVATLRKIKEAQEREEVLFAEPAEVGFEDFVPQNENQLPDFESVSNGDRRWNLEMINIDKAHNISRGSPTVTIFTIDSGIRPDHQDLRNALRPDWATLDLNFDTNVIEAELSPVELTISHGTKVASIIGGQGPGGESRVMGVAPECWLLPVKISGAPFAQSYSLRAVAILEAIDYVSKEKKGIINISWSTNGEHLGIREALIEASSQGLAITTSAGNYRLGEVQIADKIHYPSNYAYQPSGTAGDIQARRKIVGLLSVAALDAFKKKATYSYYGSQSVTISAPGGEPGEAGTGVFVASTPNDYSYDAGTSFAAPHVAGLLALIWSIKPNLSVEEVIEIVRATSSELDTNNPSFTNMLGAGLINAQTALESFSEVAPPTVTSTLVAENIETHLLDINAATINDFILLPYIGEWTALAIVAYRTTNGPYSSIWDLALTGAIDRWVIEQINPLITVKPGAAREPSNSQGEIITPGSTNEKININIATVEQLESLPFIGIWSANKIVSFRTVHGPYKSIYELVNAGSIDNWTINQIKGLIMVQ